jgi:hypothetical protein
MPTFVEKFLTRLQQCVFNMRRYLTKSKEDLCTLRVLYIFGPERSPSRPGGMPAYRQAGAGSLPAGGQEGAQHRMTLHFPEAPACSWGASHKI